MGKLFRELEELKGKIITIHLGSQKRTGTIVELEVGEWIKFEIQKRIEHLNKKDIRLIPLHCLTEVELPQ